MRILVAQKRWIKLNKKMINLNLILDVIEEGLSSIVFKNNQNDPS